MKYGKSVSIFAATLAFLLCITSFIDGKNDRAFIWLVVFIWSFTNFISELSLEQKEKEIKELQSFLESEKEKCFEQRDVVSELAEKHPNDMDLGKEVRKLVKK